MNITNFPVGKERRNSPGIDLLVGSAQVSVVYSPNREDEINVYGRTDDGKRTYRVKLLRSEAERIARVINYVPGIFFEVVIPAASGFGPGAIYSPICARDAEHAKEIARAKYADECHGAKPAALHTKRIGL